MKKALSSIITAFKNPLLVLLGLIIYIIIAFGFKQIGISFVISLICIIFGMWGTLTESFQRLKRGQFGIDYIAILAILTSIITGQYLVGIIIALMSSTGDTLEDYAANKAKTSLTSLADRIPENILIKNFNKTTTLTPIKEIKVNEIIIVRKGEVIPLDGILLSNNATLDESSLTGEAYPAEKIKEDEIRSGVVNIGNFIEIRVLKEAKNSTYKKIVNLVQKAQKEKAPLVRLADKYSMWFTIITFIIAGLAFWHTHSLISILAVFVVATPCPLILATPIALLGGMNKMAKNRVIVKKLSSIESLSKVNAIIFDKTGTITLGKPRVIKFDILDKKKDEKNLLSIAEALERNSLHPLAKAIVNFAISKKAPTIHVDKINEIIGKGIEGKLKNKTYLLSKIPNSDGADMAIGIYEDKKCVGTFYFEDEIKNQSKNTISKLEDMGITLAMYTGDKLEVAKKLIDKLNINMTLKAECKPEDKEYGIQQLKSKGKTVAMVGDGINDAPALALADVGMVFSTEEQTAATDAADVVFLGGNFSIVLDSLINSRKTIEIALQSILWGIGLSILAMIFAAFGLIPPIYGAILQEFIDVAVILNAIRAAR